MKKQSFTSEETGHAKIMNRPTQMPTPEYEILKKEYLNILEKRILNFDTDRIDNRRTIECIKANKFTLSQLQELININKINQELLNKLKPC
jgi:hypothetical protein